MRLLASTSRRAPWLAVAILAACGGADRPSTEQPAAQRVPGSRLQPTSDYAVYRIILRDQFVRPTREDHGDGLPSCLDNTPLDSLTIEAETRFIHPGGAFRDSALAAELTPGAVPLVAALRALDTQPPVPVLADSFAVGVPVTLVAGLANGGLRVGVITLSRVAYNADSTAAMVHVARPCRVEPGPDPEEEPGPQGLSVLSVLRRQGEAWSVSEVVYLELE